MDRHEAHGYSRNDVRQSVTQNPCGSDEDVSAYQPHNPKSCPRIASDLSPDPLDPHPSRPAPKVSPTSTCLSGCCASKRPGFRCRSASCKPPSLAFGSYGSPEGSREYGRNRITMKWLGRSVCLLVIREAVCIQLLTAPWLFVTRINDNPRSRNTGNV